jgi:hypothetical protein
MMDSDNLFLHGGSQRLTRATADKLTEAEIQRAVFAHLRIRGAPGIFAFHPKNASADMAGRKRGIHVGLGVEPGVPDVIVLQTSATGTRVFALELKRENRRNRKPTAHEMSQEATRRRLAACGCDRGVAYGLDEALAWLESRGLLRSSANRCLADQGQSY